MSFRPFFHVVKLALMVLVHLLPVSMLQNCVYSEPMSSSFHVAERGNRDFIENTPPKNYDIYLETVT